MKFMGNREVVFELAAKIHDFASHSAIEMNATIADTLMAYIVCLSSEVVVQLKEPYKPKETAQVRSLVVKVSDEIQKAIADLFAKTVGAETN